MTPQASDPGRVARALRWLAVAALLYPLGRAVVDPTFAALGRPVPSLASRGVVALYFAIPAAAIALAMRVKSRPRILFHLGASLSLLGLALEWAPVRFESAVGAVFSFANDTSINAGVVVLAFAVAAVQATTGMYTRRSSVVLEGSAGLTVAILVEVVWTRLRGPSPAGSADRGSVAYVLGQIVFVMPLVLLAAGAFLRARAVGEALDGPAHEAPASSRLLQIAGLSALSSVGLLLFGANFFATPRLVWTLGALAVFVATVAGALVRRR